MITDRSESDTQNHQCNSHIKTKKTLFKIHNLKLPEHSYLIRLLKKMKSSFYENKKYCEILILCILLNFLLTFVFSTNSFLNQSYFIL